MNASQANLEEDESLRGLRRLAIITGKESEGGELKAAEMLRSRILKRSRVAVSTAVEGSKEAEEAAGQSELVFVVGSPEGNGLARQLMKKEGVRLPTLPNSQKVHPESFVVRSLSVKGAPHVLVIGSDQRGTIYAVGWVLRRITFLQGALDVPNLAAEEKPAFWMRGGNPSGPGSRAQRYGKLRPQTAEERREMMEDLMLLGTNTFGGDPGTARSYGMLTTFGRTVNEWPRKPDGTREFPKEWAADGGISREYVCPSIPEARAALLESFERMFKEAPGYDFFTTNSGDSGGCRCDRCMPWGRTYIKLLHEIADLLHKYHPDCKILATNQDLTNEGNQAIFDYLNQGDSSWLFAIRYGPGADEMQTYIRGPVNPRWFEYEGFGPLGNYLKRMHHELPRETNIALYSDITHWMQSQFGVPEPDVVLAAVYGRRSWNARPKHFHRVAMEIFHYALGDMHYSEGMHDDFNKWLWYRLLWNPHLSAEEITEEYCRYWFGPQAAEDAARAIFLMEETLEKPLIDNPGISEAVDLLRSAGEKIPENLKRIDYRRRIIMQKALMDRYIQLEVIRGGEIKRRASLELEKAVASKDPKGSVERALRILEEPLENAEMKAVMEEALALGEESNRIVGYRVPAPFIVEELDLTEIGWWRKTLRRALESERDEVVTNAVNQILKYEDPGEGGYYESPGWPKEAKHLVHGETLWGFMPFPGPARLSHYGLVYSWGRDGKGVTFLFDGLDPEAEYVVRISVGVHLEGGEIPVEGLKLEEGLTANGRVVSDGFPVPVGEIAFHEFDLPRDITADGRVEICLVGKSEVFPVTGLCEIWLMRRDRMPWTASP